MQRYIKKKKIDDKNDEYGDDNYGKLLFTFKCKRVISIHFFLIYLINMW